MSAVGDAADPGFVSAELDALAPADTTTPPADTPKKRGRGRPKKGVCRDCGEPATTRDSTYCAEHQPLKQDGAKPRARARATTGGRAAKLETELATQLTMLGQIWQAADPVCGAVMVNQAPQIAAFWAAQAKSNPRVALVVETISGGGGIVGGLFAHVPLFMAVWAHHVIEPRRARAAQAEQLPPVGAVAPAPNGQPYVHQGGGNWAPATPADIAAWDQVQAQTQGGEPPADAGGGDAATG